MRRMGREDFRSASPFEKGTDRGYFNWVVYGDYELVERDRRHVYFRVSSDERAKFYQPLAHTPYLFLEFARIAEQRGQLDEGLNNWIRKYGMLGLSSYRPNGPLEPPAWEYWALNTDLYPEVILSLEVYQCRWAGR